MRILVGTSGYDYDPWKGIFYPPEVKKARRLAYYASRFGTCEINASFYRKPSAKALQNWSSQVPDGFVFAFKAWNRITHIKRLKDCAELVEPFVSDLKTMGAKLGPVLFGLPPNFKQDVVLLRELLAQLPPGLRAAFEFRHQSWLADDTYKALADASAALCVADTDELSTPFVRTAPFGYLRLRKPEYDAASLQAWAARIHGGGFTEDVHVYFKHEDEARGPAFAEQLLPLVSNGA